MFRHRFGILLTALLFLLVAAPAVSYVGAEAYPRLTQILVMVLFVSVLLSAAFAGSESRVTRIIALSLAGPTIIAQVALPFADGNSLLITSRLLNILFLGTIIAIVLRFVFESRQITSNTIWAALCVYLMAGVLGALAYLLIGSLSPNAFLSASPELGIGPGASADQQLTSALYYSFVTMSTLGYGDIVPTTPPVRMLAALQAVFGQLYIAVLVARLVGLHIVHSTENRNGTRNEGHS